MSEHSVLVKMQLSEGLPPILGDRVQLQQVMLNLIMNAIEAMSEAKRDRANCGSAPAMPNRRACSSR